MGTRTDLLADENFALPTESAARITPNDDAVQQEHDAAEAIPVEPGDVWRDRRDGEEVEVLAPSVMGWFRLRVVRPGDGSMGLDVDPAGRERTGQLLASFWSLVRRAPAEAADTVRPEAEPEATEDNPVAVLLADVLGRIDGAARLLETRAKDLVKTGMVTPAGACVAFTLASMLRHVGSTVQEADLECCPPGGGV